MKNAIFIILLILTSNSVLSQNRNAEYLNELTNIEINELLYAPISNLTENEILEELKKKTNSELNTLASILLNYKFAETLDIKIKEQTRLQIRMVEMADHFYKNNKLIFLEHSSGSLPTFAEEENIYNNKKVRVLLMGGGTCIMDEIDYKAKRMYSIFNERMKKNIED
jgi:hypothetical protein